MYTCVHIKIIGLYIIQCHSLKSKCAQVKPEEYKKYIVHVHATFCNVVDDILWVAENL